MLFLFDGGHLVPEQLDRIVHQSDEITQHAYQPLERLSKINIPRLSYRIRIRAAVASHATGETRHLEYGTDPR